METQLLRIADIAQFLGLGRTKTYDLVLRGIIPSVVIPGTTSRRVSKIAFHDWLRENGIPFASGTEVTA